YAVEPATAVHHRMIDLRSSECLEFIDLTEVVEDLVAESGVRNGLVNIQTLHTTTAIIINESEPLLIEDMKARLESLAPRDARYCHDDFEIRTVNLEPDEPENGHSHCKALFLRASETINIHQGKLLLGRWQRIFLIELDRPRARSVSVMIMGQ
ncbi:MAG TPA: secondary thiamine-phosphate synthase enzyme YjbQ, partial [Blastocatellia bacterium]